MNKSKAMVIVASLAIVATISLMSMKSTTEKVSAPFEKAEKALTKVGKLEYPIAYDVSQANPWGIIWSNVYYMTNEATGIANEDLGVVNVLRHHGMIFALDDATIKKYELGKYFNYKDPATGEFATRNPFYQSDDKVFPVPGLSGIKDLQAKGAVFFVCDMARRVNAQFVAKQKGLDPEEVYQDFVKGTLPGVIAAPSGVWVLGRLNKNNITYVDASVG